MFNPFRGAILSAVLLVFSAFCGFATAAVERELSYTADLEAHSEESDEVTSTLTLNLSDERAWTRYRNRYDLLFEFNYEHQEEEDSSPHRGFYYGSYHIAGPDFIWDLNADFEVFAEESGREIDTFESQNLTTLSTGPTIRLFKNLRGTTELNALVSDIKYSESDLDSTQEDVALKYIYPISVSRGLIVNTFYRSVEFDDDFNSASEYDATGIRLVFNSATRTSDLGINVAVSEFDNENNITNQEEISLRYLYRLTGRSSVEFQVADILQTSAEFNRANPTDNNGLFQSSLIRNERVSLGYTYADSVDSFGVTLYREKLQILFGEASGEDVTGLSAGWTRILSEQWVFVTEIDVTENNFLDQKFESLTSTLTYNRRHNANLFSELDLSVEVDEIDDERVEDYILAYRLIALILK